MFTKKRVQLKNELQASQVTMHLLDVKYSFYLAYFAYCNTRPDLITGNTMLKRQTTNTTDNALALQNAAKAHHIRLLCGYRRQTAAMDLVFTIWIIVIRLKNCGWQRAPHNGETVETTRASCMNARHRCSRWKQWIWVIWEGSERLCQRHNLLIQNWI